MYGMKSSVSTAIFVHFFETLNIYLQNFRLTFLYSHSLKMLNGPSLNITQKRKELNLYDIFKEWEYKKVNLKFCKYMLRVSKKCTNIAVLTELGRLSYNLMLNSGKKIRVLCAKKKKYLNSRVVRKKNSERNKKP
jgi:hypothetical protein